MEDGNVVPEKIEKQRVLDARQALSGDTDKSAGAANALNSAAKVIIIIENTYFYSIFFYSWAAIHVSNYQLYLEIYL